MSERIWTKQTFVKKERAKKEEGKWRREREGVEIGRGPTDHFVESKQKGEVSIWPQRGFPA